MGINVPSDFFPVCAEQNSVLWAAHFEAWAFRIFQISHFRKCQFKVKKSIRYFKLESIDPIVIVTIIDILY